VIDDRLLAEWMEGYVRAWESNARDDIAPLFAEDAVYFTAPWREPWRGREGIVAGWLDRRDQQGNWSFRWEPLLIVDDLAVVTGETTYRREGTTYSNLWVMRFDDAGRCSEFTEWWMLQR
jgi:ketosteroid isomerase-like protein